jgi:hypothetical protein
MEKIHKICFEIEDDCKELNGSREIVDVNLGNILRTVWKHMNRVQLSIHSKEGKIASFPAFYGIAATAVFPVVTLSALYSLTLADVKFSIGKKEIH